MYNNLVLCLYCRVLEMLQGKGAGKNGRFQGKVNSMARRGEVETLIQEHCKNEQ